MSTSVRKVESDEWLGMPMRLTLWSQWREWFAGKFNWKNFTVIEFAIERGTYCGTYLEIEFGLLGFCGCFRWWDRMTTAVWGAEMDQEMAEIRDVMGLDEDDEEPPCRGDGVG